MPLLNTTALEVVAPDTAGLAMADYGLLLADNESVRLKQHMKE